MKKYIVIIITFIIISGIVLLFFNLEQNTKSNFKQLRLAGHIETSVTDLSFKIPGSISMIAVREGDNIIVGQILSQIESQDLQQELTIAEARVVAAKLHLAKLEIGNRPQEIKLAESSLTSAKINLIEKKYDLQRQKELFKRDSITKANLNKIQTAFILAAESAHRAKEGLNLTRDGFRKEDIALGTANLKLAQASLELARTKLSFATLKAPTSGIVLTRNAELGEVIGIGTPILTIGNLGDIWLEAYLPETELAKIQLGDPAKITIDSSSKKYYQGQIFFIASKAEFTPKTVETANERINFVFRTKIRILNPCYELKPGMPGEATFLKTLKDKKNENLS